MVEARRYVQYTFGQNAISDVSLIASFVMAILLAVIFGIFLKSCSEKRSKTVSISTCSGIKTTTPTDSETADGTQKAAKLNKDQHIQVEKVSDTEKLAPSLLKQRHIDHALSTNTSCHTLPRAARRGATYSSTIV